MAIARYLDRIYLLGPSGFWTMASLRYAAKFDPFLSLDCAPTPFTLHPRKGRDQILPSGNLEGGRAGGRGPRGLSTVTMAGPPTAGMGPVAVAPLPTAAPRALRFASYSRSGQNRSTELLCLLCSAFVPVREQRGAILWYLKLSLLQFFCRNASALATGHP